MANSSKYYIDNQAPDFDNAFWQQIAIDGAAFSQSFPYQLLILQVQEGSNGQAVYSKTPFSFTLPIPPQELSINMPIATAVQPTLNGIAEQNSGAPFRDIMISGTTGVTPIKNNAGPTDPNNILNRALATGTAIFSGTANALNRTIQAGANATIGNNVFRPNVNSGTSLTDGDPNRIPVTSTGYYQFKLLEKFIEAYVNLKKTNGKLGGVPANKLRLAFAIYKDKSIYICAGAQFQLKRSANDSPMEYPYTLQLKAWKRIPADSLTGGPAIIYSADRGPNFYSALLSRLTAASDTLSSASQVLQSVVHDPLNRVAEINRETSVFLKNATGLALTLNDLPDTIKGDIVPTLIDNWKSISSQFKQFSQIAPSLLVDGARKFLGLNFTPLSTSSIALSTPSNSITRDQILEIFSTVKPTDLPLPTSVAKLVNDEKNRVSLFSRLDFENKRDELKAYLANFMDSIGAGNPSYNITIGRGYSSQSRVPTDDEFNAMYALNEAIILLDHLAATNEVNARTPTTLEYVAGLAEKSGIAFQVPLSKFAVPFPYGFTLEKLALQYLNDANRWYEIAALNGLRDPYIDEVGFTLYLATNGSKNTITVADASNLAVNQTIYISSATQPKTARRITGIQKVYDGFYSIDVDGEPDLVAYKTVDSAKIDAFLPGTVNSQQIIYIPSSNAAPQEVKGKSIPGINEFDPLIQSAGVDLLLTQDGDLVITPDGDVRLAFGLQNIIQTVKLALTTPKGSLLQHPGYGIDLQVGDNTADVSADDLLKTAKNLFQGDPTFTGVSSASVVKNGPTVQLALMVGVAATGQEIPITINLV